MNLVFWYRSLMRSVGAALVKLIATATSGLVSFTTNVIRPVKVTCEFSPVQEGTGDPSPDNVRPIRGWTGVAITDAKKNLFNRNDIIEGGFFNRQGTVSVNYSYARAYIKVSPGDTLVYSGLRGANGSPCGIQFFDKNKSFLAFGNPDVQSNNATVVAPSGAAYIGISVFCGNNDTYKDIDTAQIEFGSTATTYEAYSATSIPINWQSEAGTVYGGTVTLNEDGSADLQPEYVLFQVDSSFGMPTGNIVSRNGYYYRQGTFASNLHGLPNRAITNDWLCNKGQSATRLPAVGDTGAIYIYSEGAYYYISVRADLLTDGTNEAFNNYLDTEKPIFCMHINMASATINIPQSIHFPNIGQLQSFLGTNNIWHNMNGDITVEYWNKISIGYKIGYNLNSGNFEENEAPNFFVTGFIPFTSTNGTIRLTGKYSDKDYSSGGTHFVIFYDAEFEPVGSYAYYDMMSTNQRSIINTSADLTSRTAYIRFVGRVDSIDTCYIKDDINNKILWKKGM